MSGWTLLLAPSTWPWSSNSSPWVCCCCCSVGQRGLSLPVPTLFLIKQQLVVGWTSGIAFTDHKIAEALVKFDSNGFPLQTQSNNDWTAFNVRAVKGQALSRGNFKCVHLNFRSEVDRTEVSCYHWITNKRNKYFSNVPFRWINRSQQ